MSGDEDTLRRSPLHDRHVALGAKMADFGGWEMPIEYPAGGVLKEHLAVREGVGVFDVSHLGKMSVTGAGAAAFVNDTLTNDLGRIGPGQAQYSLLCNADGGVVDDLIVYLRGDDDVFVIPNAANTAEVVDTMRGNAPSGVEVANQHDEYGVIAVQGPRSAEVLGRLGLPTDHDYMAFVEVDWDGRPLVVCRTGYTGEHGYELLPRWDDAAPVWDALLAAGEGLGDRARRPRAHETRCAPRWATRCTDRTCHPRSRRSRHGPGGRSAGPSPRSSAATRCWPSALPGPAGSCAGSGRPTAGSRDPAWR